MKLSMDLVIQFIAEGLVSWPTTSSGPKWTDDEHGRYINTMGWWWSGKSSFAMLTDGEKIITRDMWVMAKVGSEMKNHTPRIMSEEEFAAEHAATAIQPAPSGSGNPILGMVLADLTNRALEGKEKYGEPLKARNGRKPLWDAYQEALDLCMYLRQMIEEQKQ